MVEEKRGKGQPKKIPDSETLYKWFEEYKKTVDYNPIKKMDFKGKDADEVNYRLARPYTWVGFKVYLYKKYTIGFSTVEDYKANKEDVYADYSEIIRVIDGEIFENQYDGASVGIFQHNIVALKLGMVKKTENKTEITVKETRIGFDPDENE